MSLARTQPAEATKALPLFVAHPTWQVRMYAARAAGVLGAVDTLTTLMGDAVDNVREAALTALIELKRPEAVAAAIDSLARTDYQLVLTAVRALEDKAHAPKATSPLITALGRITKEHKDTSRDPRMAILNRLQALRRCVAGGEPRGLPEGLRPGGRREGRGDPDRVDGHGRARRHRSR